MGDYSFGPSAKGWMVIFGLCCVGVISVAVLAIQLGFYLCHHLHWVK